VKIPRHAIAAPLGLSTMALYSVFLLPSSAQAAELPAPYQGSANADLLQLNASILGTSVATVGVGHVAADVDSTRSSDNATADAANLDASLGGLPVPLDDEATSAPPTSDPAARGLNAVSLPGIATVGLLTGDVQAAYDGASQCPPATDGERVYSDGSVSLAGIDLVSVPTVGQLVSVGASQQETRTALVANPATGTSDVVSTVTTKVAPISLLGGAVQVKVASPVTLQARSDGTTATTGFVDQPTIDVVIGGTDIPIPLNGQPVDVGPQLPAALSGLVNLHITGFSPTDASSGSHAVADVQDLLRIQLSVLGALPVLPDVADVDLSLAPMHVDAQAPAGGVDCAAGDDDDGDGLTNGQEATLGTDPEKADTDGDGLTDGQEVNTYGTNPLKADTDGDGLTDNQEVTGSANGAYGNAPTDPTVADTDGDGLTDGAEETTYGTDPNKADTDAGGVDDGTEVANGTNPLDPSDDTPAPPGSLDSDGDGLTDAQEAQYGTDPHNPDTDSDGLTDGAEVNTYGTNPLKADTDGDGVNDGDEVSGATNTAFGNQPTDPTKADTDGDGISDGQEIADGTDPNDPSSPGGGDTTPPGDGGTNPQGGGTSTDTDGDGLPNSTEAQLGTNPTKADTDGDGLTDGAEVTIYHTNPLKADTDGDGISDGREVHGVKVRMKIVKKHHKKAKVKKVLFVTNPLKKDTDGDCLTDRQEETGKKNKRYHHLPTNPLKADTDHDGLSDCAEIKRYKTNPDDWDTDNGGASDGAEVRAHNNPLKARAFIHTMGRMSLED
jgi:hypothetical protein